ncbi:dihydrolipoamide acetyltransferase family protein [Salinactinospora qingdaonensis]|uniref:Dihydrolipoamide acetyltransferase component of pyruvate dehydrogenase complex n=1 Tax=Salinactinospora qingdaonensis TaxID=702744 RepID=A0ABP7F3G7_9ACTN
MHQFRLPDVGEGLTEAEVLSWNVQPGDEIAVNQIVCEIETAKAAVELPSPYAGTVTELLVEAGTTVAVGTPLLQIDTGGETAGTDTEAAQPAESGAPPSQDSPAESDSRQPVLVGYGVKAGATRRRARKRPAPATSAPPPPVNGGREPVAAKPPVRKLAKDLGVDLHSVSPTGAGGTVTRDDVRRASRQEAVPQAEPAPSAPPEAEQAPPAAAPPLEERIPIKGVRKHTATAVAGSAFTAPHVTEFLQVDVTNTVHAVAKLRERPEFAEVRVSPLLLVARALLMAVRRHPEINASWDEEAQEIVVKRYVNLGVAAATHRGLVVPNIKDADRKPLPELAGRLNELTETARAGKTTPADMTGGTITITNVGVFGVDAGTPILNPGEAAILAFGQIRDMPWVHEGELAVRKVTTLSLSFDHRMVDGELGSAVLRDVGTVLADPETVALAWG